MILPAFVHLFSSAPRLHFQFSRPILLILNFVYLVICFQMQLKLQQSGESADECPVPLNWAQSAREAHPNRKALQVKMHEGGSPTTRLTLQKANNLSRGHLKLLWKPYKRGNRLTFIST
jgi:hypothetical protein